MLLLLFLIFKHFDIHVVLKLARIITKPLIISKFQSLCMIIWFSLKRIDRNLIVNL